MIEQTRYHACYFWLIGLALFTICGSWPAASNAAHDQEDVVDTVTPERLKYYLDNKETVIIGYRNIAIMPDGIKGWLQRKFPTETGAKTN